MMSKLLKVDHADVKAKLDAEKAAKAEKKPRAGMTQKSARKKP